MDPKPNASASLPSSKRPMISQDYCDYVRSIASQIGRTEAMMTREEMQEKIADLKREQAAAWAALETEIQTKRDELSAPHGQQFDELYRRERR
jgi:hypothetical protein